MRSRAFFAGAVTFAATALAAVAFAKAAQAPVPASSRTTAPSPVPAVASEKTAAPAKPAKAAAPPAGVQAPPLSDKGTFRIRLTGVEVGSKQFETSSSGNAQIIRSETVIRVPGTTETRSKGELRFSADGTPLAYEWTSQAETKASGAVEFSDGTAKTGIIIGSPVMTTHAVVANAAAQTVLTNSAATFAVGNVVQVDVGAAQEMVAVTAVAPTSFSGIFSKNHAANAQAIRPLEQDFIFPSPRVAVLDNNLNSQYALLAQLYDWSAKGQQTFPVLIPQDMTPGSISVESLGAKTVDGASLEALRVNTADIEIVAYFDARHRLMRLEVPSASIVVIRR
jgi:hypothetical protein